MKVLVVEDDENIRAALVRFLSASGLTTVGAKDAVEALLLIELEPPDLAITDWDLGGQLTGVDVANYLTEQANNPVIVFITGKPIRALRLAAAHLDVHTFLQKPFSLGDIRLLINDIHHK